MKFTFKFSQERTAQLPALALLVNLGWTFLPPEQALASRGGRPDTVVLRDELRRQLQKRQFAFAGQFHPLSPKAIDRLVAELCSPALNEGLTAANEKVTNHLLYGICANEYIDDKKINFTVALIDWQNLANNSFQFTEAFGVLRAGGLDSSSLDTRFPDTVCFVNGIPLVVIEAIGFNNNPNNDSTIDEGISQSLRNQRHDEIPLLFAYSQLLLAINGTAGRYATLGTARNGWAAWREEYLSEAEMHAIKNKILANAQATMLFGHRPTKDLDWYKSVTAGGDLAVTDQDRLLIGLLTPVRLLDMLRYFTLFDEKAGKVVARYQQVFAAKRLVEHLTPPSVDDEQGGSSVARGRKPVAPDEQGGSSVARGRKPGVAARKGGVIWHVTGSGKSFTLAFLSKILSLHDSLKQCRIVVVTDRVDWVTLLINSFLSGGRLAGKKNSTAAMATSGTRVAEQIGKGSAKIICSSRKKFNSALRLPQCVNPSPDIIVLMDEEYCGANGESRIYFKRALPNAAFVTFTGTPLLENHKTAKTFGPMVHVYNMLRAVEDKMVTPLLYEERTRHWDGNQRGSGAGFDGIPKGQAGNQKADLKLELGKKGRGYRSEERIRLIALDIASHFNKNVPEGLKGQLACDSKLAAVWYKKYLDRTGLFESAVVIGPPDVREGNPFVDEAGMPEVNQWWQDNVARLGDCAYTKDIIRRFNHDDQLKLLIVVDKPVSGCDESKNAVLYIDKPLQEQNLMQAVARVNRRHPKKTVGLLIDYRGTLAKFDISISDSQELGTRPQSGYDINDLAGLYRQMGAEYKRLPQRYKNLWSIFSGVKNKGDIEQLRRVLIPRIREVKGELIDTHAKTRENFDVALKEFAYCLNVALQSATFFDDQSFSGDDLRHFKETLRQLSSLRRMVNDSAGEAIDPNAYVGQFDRLLERLAGGVSVREPEGVYEVGKRGPKPKDEEKPQKWSADKIRNEIDILKLRIIKSIEQDLHDAPYAQEAFSKSLRKILEEAEQLIDLPLKQYMRLRDFEDQIKARKLNNTPDAFSDNQQAQAYYGAFTKVLPATFALGDPHVQSRWINLAFVVDELVAMSVAENSINQRNLETDIHKKLLPIMFKECKVAGKGMDQAKAIVEWVVEIARVSLSSAAKTS